MILSAAVKSLVQKALQEDIGTGDITSDSIIPKDKFVRAEICLKRPGCVAGLALVEYVFKSIDRRIRVWIKKDGRFYKKNEIICRLYGPCIGILKGERTALNFLSHLSGIATITRRFVTLLKPFGVKILDTRKTTPLLRELEKYAVKIGGGLNHRLGLYDMILIKDNHIVAAGGISRVAVLALNKKPFPSMRIEIEVKNIQEFQEARSIRGINRIMFDNMKARDIRECVKLNKTMKGPALELEISGGITLKNAERYATTGVDYISSGFITHSSVPLDMTLLIRP